MNAHLGLNGVRLMLRMLELNPALQDLFSFRDVKSKLEDHIAVKRHGSTVLKTIGARAIVDSVAGGDIVSSDDVCPRFPRNTSSDFRFHVPPPPLSQAKSSPWETTWMLK